MKKNKKIIVLGLFLSVVSTIYFLRPHATPVNSEPKNDGPAVTRSEPAKTRPDSPSERTTEGASHSTVTERRTPANAPSATPDSPAPIIATKEYEYHALGVVPNDPFYATSWAMQKTGAPAAWDQGTGNPVVIAVLDTGFALDHEDLKDSWYQNPGETGTDANGKDKTNNGIDDDANGYVDDWRGWNFYGRYQPTADPCSTTGLGTYVANNNPMAGASGNDILYQENYTCFGDDPGDPHAAITHGTSTAGLAGATTNNGIGIATFNWNTIIMPLQVLGDDGSGWTSKIVTAMRYAVDNGADIINLSLGTPDADPAVKDALLYAASHNVIVVAASGNCGTGNEYGCDPALPGQMMYPAGYPQAIAVGAVDQNDTVASFSSYGRGLDVVAPGYGTIVSPSIKTDIQPYNMTSAYATGLSGTSFSSPIVASIASLIRSARPSSNMDDIIALISATARKPSGMNGALYTTRYGHGVVDAGTAAVVAGKLNIAPETVPSYAQTGSHVSEHTFRIADNLSSGCTVTADTYCTIRFEDVVSGYTRYLPYAPTDTDGQTGWQWQGSLLGNGEWLSRAESGNVYSTNNYLLFSK